MDRFLRQKRKRNRIIVAAGVVVAVAVAARKYKKIGQGKETRRFREPMEMRTGQRMRKAIDKWRKIDKLNLIRNNRLRTNNNPNHDYHKSNPNIDLNYISPQYNTSHKLSSLHPQQHSASPSLEETLALLRAVSPGDPQGYKDREPESKQQKLLQYAGLIEVIERFHEIMKPIIEEEKKKPDTMLPGQYKHYLNKDGPIFFYPPKNYRPTPIHGHKDLNLSEEQRKQFDGDNGRTYQKGHTSQDYQTSVMEWLVMSLIVFTAEQIVQSETENMRQLTRELERIVADGTDDNGNDDQSLHAIEPKHFTNGNDGLGKNDGGTQLHATVNGEANPKINIAKISANTPSHNVNGSDRLGGNGCGTQGAGLLLATHHEYELRNPNISQPKGQQLLITLPPELSQVKEKVIVPKQKTQQVNKHDTRSKTGQPKSVPDKSLGSPEVRANSDTPNHFTPQQEQRKKADVAPVTKNKSVKHFKGNNTSVGSKKQKQRFITENLIEIEPDSETDQPEQLDQVRRKGGKKGKQIS
ncbi:MAG: hypothetical protein EZS28_010150 [Streblomastix strix]|uniref:Uncharacterized protein n=1 Tax=Streblomastix strix TaxID=222440 RepID=A0A5J4WGX8_9EUKA|nr:MAG: hypothetical protein EZS28_010150 [Streblomastix strix]